MRHPWAPFYQTLPARAMRRAISMTPMLPLLVAGAIGAAAAASPGSPPQSSDFDARPRLRAGIVMGGSLGVGLGGASGYPNDSTKIGDPAFYSASPWMPGETETVLALGALADYLNFGFWFGHEGFRNRDWRLLGNAGGLRVEAFPLIVAYPRLAGLGVFGQFGVGSGTLTSAIPGRPQGEGTQSFVATGAFYEWAFGHLIGGHFAAGPSLEFDAIWSLPFETHGLVASARVVFYGGP
jgi:hypothetical protein